MSSASELRDIAGAKITTKFISVQGGESIADIRRTITTRSTEFDLIDYVLRDVMHCDQTAYISYLGCKDNSTGLSSIQVLS